MRKIICIILCCLILAVPVFAHSGISSAESQTVVESDGTCQITLTITLQLDAADPGLVFPLPGQARDITVNGSAAKSVHVSGMRNVELADIVTGAGSYTLTFRYSLPDAVTEDEKGNLILTVPLLSGFALPVETMHFSITLPDTPEKKPSFISTYYLENAQSILSYEIQGTVISGSVNQRLQDRESLTMTLSVSEKMFPQSMSKRWSMDTVDLIMLGLGVLAILYWMAAIRCRVPKKIRTATPPEGITAGEIGCRLTGRGMDLTLTVLSWAQMGYLLIQMDENGRVLLHKRMDMGNERSELENRYFRSLFRKREIADGTGYHYARLCRKALHSTPGMSITYARNSGNPRVFRVLAAAIGTFSGVSLAYAFANDTGWRTVLSILLGILGSLAAWQMQSAAKSLYHRNKLPLLAGLGCGLVWLLLSILAGEWNVAAFVIPAQFLAGLAAFYGGIRTESGQQASAQLLGLRRYLRTVSKEELKRILKANPHYYYDLAPYALALDADRAFARQFGNIRLPECTYLTTGMDGHMTVQEWNQLLRDTVNAMDALQKRMPIDRLLGK